MGAVTVDVVSVVIVLLCPIVVIIETEAVVMALARLAVMAAAKVVALVVASLVLLVIIVDEVRAAFVVVVNAVAFDVNLAEGNSFDVNLASSVGSVVASVALSSVTGANIFEVLPGAGVKTVVSCENL